MEMPLTSPTGEASDALEIRECSARDDFARDALVRSAGAGSPFHLSAWRRFVEDTYGLASHDLAAWRDGRLVGVLPLTMCRGLMGSRKLVSVPFGVYGGPVSKQASVARSLIEAACALADRQRVSFLELRCVDDPGVDLPGTELYWTFVRRLPERAEEVLAGMPKKARAEARKARQRHGLELVEGVWYVNDLAQLFLKNKHALGSPALPPKHFDALLSHLGREAFVHVVRRGQKPIAAVMSFAFQGRLIAYYAGTEPGADRAYGASNFMYMALQEWAVDAGFREFDFSRSRGDSGAFRFKVHQGFEPRPLHYRYHLVGAREAPSFNPSNPRTALLRKTWARLPVGVVRGLSGFLAPRLG